MSYLFLYSLARRTLFALIPGYTIYCRHFCESISTLA